MLPARVSAPAVAGVAGGVAGGAGAAPPVRREAVAGQVPEEPGEPVRLALARPSPAGLLGTVSEPAPPRTARRVARSTVPRRFWRADIRPELMYELRSPEKRRLTAVEAGATPESEEAVERALKWLAARQNPDGSWGPRDRRRSALTGLALLAFLGAGYTHREGPYAPTVGRAVNWYLQHARPDGDLRVGGRMYGQGMSTIALCEAYTMTKDPRLRAVTQNAVGFIIRARNPRLGGWRYQPRYSSNDTSLLGWQIMALKSGEASGIEVPGEVYEGAQRWLKRVSAGRRRGLFGYASPVPKPAMTAEGMVCRQFMGAERDDPAMLEGADYLMKHLPTWNGGRSRRNFYYWYYGTLACYQMRDPYWSRWNARLRDMLVMRQLKTGKEAGSWSPGGTAWGGRGGPIYTTAMGALCLEVYYRYLPLYRQGERLAAADAAAPPSRRRD